MREYTVFTQENKLSFYRLLKKQQTPFLNGRMYEWFEDGIKIGEYCSDQQNGGSSILWYRGNYADCIKWHEEAADFWDKLKKAYDEIELNQLRLLGLDI